MTILQSLILGIIEGLTEFLPVSSTAHLLIAQELMGISADKAAFAFTVLVQLGAIFALILYFWKDLWELVTAFVKGIVSRKPFEDPKSRLAWMVGLGSIPSLAAGFLLRNVVKELFTDPFLSAGIRLLVTSIILFLAETLHRSTRSLGEMTWLDSLIIGIVQILSVFPGSSRSGAAITGGMFSGFDRPSSARFAFLLSVPLMLAAGGYQALSVIRRDDLAFLPLITVGLVAAGIVGWYSIRWLINYVSKRSFYPFAIYCFVLGVISLVLNFVH